MNKEKSKQLGMSYGKAGNILRKQILFNLIQKCNLDTCYRCNKPINNINDLSIEHKTPWLHSDNPTELYFNLDNIAFSHLSCNSSDARRPYKIKQIEGKLWCRTCKQYKDINDFYECHKHLNSSRCKLCNVIQRNERRQRKRINKSL